MMLNFLTTVLPWIMLGVGALIILFAVSRKPKPEILSDEEMEKAIDRWWEEVAEEEARKRNG